MASEPTGGGGTDIVSLFMTVIGLVVTTTIAMFGWVMARLRSLETRQRDTPTREEVQMTVNQAVQPIREDVRDVKATGQKTYELLVKYITERANS